MPSTPWAMGSGPGKTAASRTVPPGSTARPGELPFASVTEQTVCVARARASFCRPSAASAGVMATIAPAPSTDWSTSSAAPGWRSRPGSRPACCLALPDVGVRGMFRPYTHFLERRVVTAEGLQRVLAPCLERPFPGSHTGEGRVWGAALCARARGERHEACLPHPLDGDPVVG